MKEDDLGESSVLSLIYDQGYFLFYVPVLLIQSFPMVLCSGDIPPNTALSNSLVILYLHRTCFPQHIERIFAFASIYVHYVNIFYYKDLFLLLYGKG